MSSDRAEALRRKLARQRGLSLVERATDPRPPTLAWAANLADGFARAVELFGERTAVRYEGDGLSYRDLDARVAALAGVLADRTTDRKAPIAILLDRSIDMVVAALAVIRVGASYVPIDPATPAGRVASILADAAPSLVLTSRALTGLTGPGVPALLLDEPLPPAAPLPAAVCRSRWDSRAYVIFTSGTTGRPKGVQVSHGNLLRLFTATEAQYEFGPTDVWTLFHSFAFDFSVWEMWGPLLYGGCLVIVPSDVAKDASAFRALLRREGVTMLSQTPTAFTQLIAEDADHADRLPLRWVVFGGEALHFTDLAPWVAKYGDAAPRLANMYGITETTVHASFRRVHHDDLGRTGSLIGTPLSDLDFVLVDDDLNPVPDGQPGEIIVTGPGVATGYLNQPTLTTERFITINGHRGYRSGDLATKTTTGEYTYLGRKDDQVKIRGFRIELGEVEGAVRAVPGLAGAAVAVRNLPEHGPSLVAYVVPDPAGAPAAVAIRQHLKRVLPGYMLPARFEFLDALPMNANGKLDRAALPAPGERRSSRHLTAVEPAEPADEIISAVHDIVAGLLGEPAVSHTADFFELGGHSLLATRVLAGVHDAFGVPVRLRDFLRTPTIHALAEAVRAELAERASFRAELAERASFRADSPRQTVNPALLPFHDNDNDDAASVVVALPGVLGFGLSFAQLSATMADRPWYAVNLRDVVAARSGELTLPALVDDLAGLVTGAARGRPVHVVGHSLGGTLGFYLAGALRERGQALAGLVLLDAVEPALLAEELAKAKDYRMWEFLTHVATVFPEATSQWAATLPPDQSAVDDEVVATAERLLGADVAGLFDRGLVAAFHDYLRLSDLHWPTPVPLPCPALLVGAKRSPAAADRQRAGWAPLLPALRSQEINADHVGMIQTPHADALAALLTGFFADVDSRLFPDHRKAS